MTQQPTKPEKWEHTRPCPYHLKGHTLDCNCNAETRNFTLQEVDAWLNAVASPETLATIITDYFILEKKFLRKDMSRFINFGEDDSRRLGKIIAKILGTSKE